MCQVVQVMQILEVANLDNWYDLNLEFNDMYHMESIGHGWTVKLVFENQMGKGYWLQKNDFQFDQGMSKLPATDNSETNFNSFLLPFQMFSPKQKSQHKGLIPVAAYHAVKFGRETTWLWLMVPPEFLILMMLCCHSTIFNSVAYRQFVKCPQIFHLLGLIFLIKAKSSMNKCDQSLENQEMIRLGHKEALIGCSSFICTSEVPWKRHFLYNLVRVLELLEKTTFKKSTRPNLFLQFQISN